MAWTIPCDQEGVQVNMCMYTIAPSYLGCNSAQPVNLAKSFSQVQSWKAPTLEGETLFILLMVRVYSNEKPN